MSSVYVVGRDPEKEFEEKTELLRVRDEYEKRLNQVKKELSKYIEQFTEIEGKLAKDDLAEGEEIELQKHYYHLASIINKLKDDEELCKSNLSKAQDQLLYKKRFRKEVFLQNLRVLLKESDIKIGQIERESGIQTGYVSRLEKPGNTTDPTAEFIMTASQMLNVPIDLLVKVAIGEMSASERKMLKFFQSLIEDTRNGELAWNKEAKAFFEKEKFRVLDDVTGVTDHPLIRVESCNDRRSSSSKKVATYLTSFYPNEGVRVNGNSYNTLLPGTDASIYLMKCGKYDDSTGTTRDFYEVYFVEKRGRVNPVCCTLQCAESVAEIVKALYLEIEIAGKQAHLTPGAMAIIDSYYKSKRGSHAEEGAE